MRFPLGALALLSVLATSCVLSIGGSGSSSYSNWSSDDAHALRRTNRTRLASLEIGMSRADVDAVMGSESRWLNDNIGWIDNPYRSSSFKDEQGRAVTVLYYYTDLEHRDDVITEGELTPVVLRDGEVIGWGKGFAIPVAGR